MALRMEEVAAALPSYEIGGELGRGSTGIVLAARHRRLGRDVAVKLLPPDLAEDPVVRRRFVDEAKLLASFSHVHIVPVFDFVEQDGLCLLVMERLDGGTLDDYARAGLDAPAGCAAVLALCSALHYAHERGVLHRDVKPSNVLIAGDGVVKVSDFGIAKVLGGAETLATRSGFVLGTPAYMAPEQADNDVEPGPATDIYGAGTVLYELLSGRLPFPPEGNPLQMLYNHVYSDPQPLLEAAPDVPEDLAGVVMRALERDPVGRYRSADDFGVAIASAAATAWGPKWLTEAPFTFAAAGAILTAAHSRPAVGETLVDVVDEEPREVVPVAQLRKPPPPAAPRARRGRLALAAGVAALLAAAGVAVALVVGRGDDPEPAGERAPARATPLPASEWKSLPDMVFAQQQMPGAVLGARVLLPGGLAAGPVSTGRTQSFDTDIDRWQAGPELPRPLNHAMAVVYRGELLVMGGWVGKGSDLTATTSDRVFALEGSKWVERPRLTTPRAAGAAAVVDGRVVVVGGQADGHLVRTTDVFDGRRWTEASPIPTPREHLAAAADGGFLYAVGGVAGGSDQKALERYSPANDAWEKLPSMNVARNGLGAAFVGGRLFAVGGETSTEVLGTVESYDPGGERWEEGEPMRTPRHGMALVALGDTLYALGGARAVGHQESTKVAEALTFDER